MKGRSMKKIQFLISFMCVMVFSVLLSPVLYADKVGISDVKSSSCVKTGGTVASSDDPDKGIKAGDCVGGNNIASIFRTITNILLFLVGAVAVIMLVVGGLKYVTSNGDQTAITSAKNTILYAIIGIVVAFMAFAAVNFVVDSLT